MSWLLALGLKNAILALPLAALALTVQRYFKRPALSHLLWAIVLLKLLTPPLVEVPVGWQIDVEGWLARGAAPSGAADRPAAAANGRVGQNVAAQGRAAATSPSRRQGSIRRAGNAGGKSVSRRAVKPVPGPPLWRIATSWLASSANWPLMMVVVWGAGSAAIVVLFLFRASRFRRYLRRATARDEYLAPRVAELAHLVGLAIPPRVIVVDGIVSPMLFGLGQRACLIFPARLAQRLSPQKLDSLLLHELGHYWRGDHWMRALELAALVAYWWNPIVWLARREIEAAEEECCDAWVVERQRGTRFAYAEALLTTIDFLCERPVQLPPIACGLGEVELIRLRLTQIVRGQLAAGASRTLQVAVIAAGLLISPLEPALWATSGPAPSRVRRAGSASAPLKHRAEPISASLVADASPALPPAPRVIPSRLPQPSLTAASQAMAIDPPRVPSPRSRALWAAAAAPNGRFKLEARSGWRTTLVTPQIRLDMTAHGIRCLSFSPDSRMFATGHADALVRLWDSESGGLEKSLQGSQAEITSIHISPSGTQVAAGAKDGSVLVWDLANGEVVAQLPPQNAPISCLRWSKGGDRLAIAHGDFRDPESCLLFIWAPREGVIIHELPLEQPAGAITWLGDDQALLVAAWSGASSVWNVASGQVIDNWQLEKDRISAAAWSADCPLTPPLLSEPPLASDSP